MNPMHATFVFRGQSSIEDNICSALFIEKKTFCNNSWQRYKNLIKLQKEQIKRILRILRLINLFSCLVDPK